MILPHLDSLFYLILFKFKKLTKFQMLKIYKKKIHFIFLFGFGAFDSLGDAGPSLGQLLGRPG